MFAAPFPINAKPPAAGFVGQIIGNLTLSSAPLAGAVAYSPVNKLVYLTFATSVVACDLSGTPSVVATISIAATALGIAYLPVSDKVFVLQGSHKYQLIDCTNNTAAAAVTMTGTSWAGPAVCGSFSVDQSTDDVYMSSAYQIGRVAPGTGVVTSPGFDVPDPGYASFLDTVSQVAYQNAQGLLYAATAHTSHTLLNINPSSWNTVLNNDYGGSATGIGSSTSKMVINRDTGHVYINGISSNKLYVMPDATTLNTITPTVQTERGDYDSVLKMAFFVETGSPGYVTAYDATDTLVVRTNIGAAVVNTPVAIYCDSLNGRYAIQKASAGETLQIIAR